MPAGRTVEAAAAEEQARLAAASAARWDPVLELALPVGVAALGLIGLAVAAALWAVIA